MYFYISPAIQLVSFVSILVKSTILEKSLVTGKLHNTLLGNMHLCEYISCLSPDLQYFIMLYCSVELRQSNSRRTKTSILCE